MTDMPLVKGSSTQQAEITPAPSDTRHFLLEYPEIPLHLSLESLLVHSLSYSTSSPSATMPAPEPHPPALDDSWASLTDVESSNDDDLRSEHTDVGSLLDVHSSEDVQSVIDEEHISDDDVGDTSTEDFRQGSILAASVQQEDGISYGSSQAHHAILSSPEVRETVSDAVRTETIIRSLGEEEKRKLRRQFRTEDESTEFLSVIQMTLSEGGLDLDTLEYFKVVLLGRHVEQFRPEIQRKLGDALVSRRVTSPSMPTSVSRFHLVPNSFGPGSEPDFADLVAIDKQIDFDCYDLVDEDILPGDRTSLILRNSQTQSRIVSEWNGSRYVVVNPRWTPPDLAIICVHLDQNHKMHPESHRLLAFAARHGIPGIHIRMDRDWHGDYSESPSVVASLSESIELRHELPQQVQPFARLPVDMAAFLNLDSASLNKHIAYVTSSVEPTSPDERATVLDLPKEVPKNNVDYLGYLVNHKASFARNVLVILWIVGLYTFLGAHLWPVVYDTLSGPSNIARSLAAESPVSILSEPGSGSPSLSQTPLQTPFSDIPDHATERGSRTTRQALAVASTSALPSLAADAMHFQVSIVSDSQVMVKLPKMAMARKHRPVLSVVLKRANHTVSAVVQELFDGVFSIQLQPHDAYGDIEVNLATSKPDLSETLTLCFGNRPILHFLPIKQVLDMIEEKFQVLAALPSSLQDRTPGTPGAVIQDFTEGVQRVTRAWGEIAQELWSRHPEWRQPSALKASAATLQSRISESTEAFHIHVLDLAEEGTKLGRHVLGRLSDGSSNAQMVVSKLVETIHVPGQMLHLDTAAVIDKLSTAQERVQQIVSQGAAKLRAAQEQRRSKRSNKATEA